MREFISFSMLGRYGRLCNQMFQVAAVSCLARERGFELLLPTVEFAEVRKHFKIQAHDFDNNSASQIKFQWNEPRFAYSPEIKSIPGNCDLVGYFQSWRYLSDPEFVREMFRFDPDLVKNVMSKLAGTNTKVAVHVRRGDYITLRETHPPLDLSYYLSAMDIVKQRVGHVEFVVFSDDRDWCAKNIPDAFIYSGSSDIEDLCAMSTCTHHIIANSSFSWWGSWLANSDGQIVIAPKRWFGEKGPKDTQDLLPEHYEVIDV